MENRRPQLIEMEIDAEAPKEFDCGNGTINEMVKNSFFPHLINQQKVFKILFGEQVVAYYAISLSRIQEEGIALEYNRTPEFGVIYLDYIAVDVRFQKKGIGSILLDTIILKGRKLSEIIPARILVLEALQGKEAWYNSRAFITFKDDKANGKQYMYFDLLSAERLAKIEAYSETLL